MSFLLDRYGHRDHPRYPFEYWRWDKAECEASLRQIAITKLKPLLKGLRLKWYRETLPFNQNPNVNLP